MLSYRIKDPTFLLFKKTPLIGNCNTENNRTGYMVSGTTERQKE